MTSSHVQLSYTSAEILGKTIILGRNVRFSKQFITERLRSPFWWATFRPHLLGISAKKMQFSIACRFLHSLSAILIHWDERFVGGLEFDWLKDKDPLAG